MVSIEDIKLPPHHIEAEKAAISAIFIENDVLFIFDWLPLLPDDFYQKEHVLVYEGIHQLWLSRKTIDVLTLSDQLQKMGYLDIVGWTDYLFELAHFLVSVQGAQDYARIVKEKSILRRILRTSQGIIGDVYEQKDTLEIIDSIEKKIFDLTQINISDSTMHIKDILNKRIDVYMEIVDNPEKINENKVHTKYQNLDKTLWGMKPWELIILAARPSMWKTAFALNLLANASVQQQKTCVFFSLEMGADQIVDRVLSLIAGIPMSKITKWALDNNDFAQLGDAMEKLGETNIFVDDKAGASVSQLKSKLRRLKIEKWSLDLVIIDYLQLMNSAGSKFAGNRVQEISEISRWLKELARELWVPIVALSQLSRWVEQRVDKKPGLSDLRESGAIEQDADTVIMLYREDYYDPETERKWTADVLVRKNRNWPTGEIEFLFEKGIMKFLESDKEVWYWE